MMTHLEVRQGVETHLMVERGHYGVLQSPHQAYALMVNQQNRLLSAVAHDGPVKFVVPALQHACRNLAAFAVMFVVDICWRAPDATVLDDVFAELVSVRRKRERVSNWHQGWAVIQQELDRLWAEIKADADQTPDGRERMRKKALLVGAMAVAFLTEILGG